MRESRFRAQESREWWDVVDTENDVTVATFLKHLSDAGERASALAHELNEAAE